MQIFINQQPVEVLAGETLLQTCRRIGVPVPSLCWVEGAAHKPSCMVCMVRDEATGQMVPSCSTYPVEGMRIDTVSDEVLALRKMGVELLMSDHRADCEAPCVTVCPSRLNVEGVLYYYDRGNFAAARQLLAAVFDLPSVGCDDCKAPCEKVCRRGTVDVHVPIREIIKELAQREDLPVTGNPADVEKQDKTLFTSRIGAFTGPEKVRLRAETDAPSTCLHCACSARNDCRLREVATLVGLKGNRFGLDSHQPFKVRKHIVGDLWFEPAKCIRCGLCVYNSKDGFAFKGRGFTMQIDIPEENKAHVDESLASLCPTGALSILRG